MTITREELHAALKEGVCEITFTKVSGEVRTMPCTLKETLIPAPTKSDAISQKRVRELNEAVMVAWCTDKNEWRSFRVANVTAVNKL